MNKRRTVLIWGLRIFGGMGAAAAPAVLLPQAWMAAIHEWAGLGQMPVEPIVGYLARNLSLFYTLVGGLTVALSTDVERYAPLIRFAGWASAVAGVAMLGIDLHEGLPWLWTLHEGPAATAFGLALVWLARDLP